MSRFSKTFLRDNGGWLPRRTAHVVHLGAFGKHPGWNDHIDDIGLESPSLLLARQLLYVEGIGGQISAGAWERLAGTDRLAEFHHAFIWRRDAAMLVGRIWPSRDGKNRAQFPMIACAHFPATLAPKAFAAAHAILDRLESNCRSTESADAVRALCAEARDAVRRLDADNGSGPGAVMPPDPDVSAAVRSLAAVLHDARSTLAACRRRWLSIRREAPPIDFRVPAVSASPANDLWFWSRVFDAIMRPGTPILCLKPLAGDWLDVIAGEPRSAHFFCLRAAPAARPPLGSETLQVPSKFARQAARLVPALLGARVS